MLSVITGRKPPALNLAALIAFNTLTGEDMLARSCYYLHLQTNHRGETEEEDNHDNTVSRGSPHMWDVFILKKT